MKNNKNEEKLLSRNFCLMTTANFLEYFAFYLIMPILAFYMTQGFGTDKAEAGLIISCFTIATLIVRPFSGFIVDSFPRKPIYILSYIIFTLAFLGYIAAGTITAVIIFRLIHGASYGTLSTSGNTILIDVLPTSRRSEGVGWFGVANTVAMIFGPMTALYLYKYYSINTIFTVSMLFSCAGAVLCSCIKVKPRPKIQRSALSLDRFFLIKGLPEGMAFLIFGIPYAAITNFIALYISGIRLQLDGGTFFMIMAFGLIGSRLFSGRMCDRGEVIKATVIGMVVETIGLFGLTFGRTATALSPIFAVCLFGFSAFLIGFGYGTIFPAFNTIFVNLADHNRRGTAISTYLTCWDVGAGTGILLCGVISEYASFALAFLTNAVLALAATLYFIIFVRTHYYKNKIA